MHSIITENDWYGPTHNIVDSNNSLVLATSCITEARFLIELFDKKTSVDYIKITHDGARLAPSYYCQFNGLLTKFKVALPIKRSFLTHSKLETQGIVFDWAKGVVFVNNKQLNLRHYQTLTDLFIAIDQHKVATKEN